MEYVKIMTQIGVEISWTKSVTPSPTIGVEFARKLFTIEGDISPLPIKLITRSKTLVSSFQFMSYMIERITVDQIQRSPNLETLIDIVFRNKDNSKKEYLQSIFGFYFVYRNMSKLTYTQIIEGQLARLLSANWVLPQNHFSMTWFSDLQTLFSSVKIEDCLALTQVIFDRKIKDSFKVIKILYSTYVKMNDRSFYHLELTTMGKSLGLGENLSDTDKTIVGFEAPQLYELTGFHNVIYGPAAYSFASVKATFDELGVHLPDLLIHNELIDSEVYGERFFLFNIRFNSEINLDNLFDPTQQMFPLSKDGHESYHLLDMAVNRGNLEILDRALMRGKGFLGLYPEPSHTGLPFLKRKVIQSTSSKIGSWKVHIIIKRIIKYYKKV